MSIQVHETYPECPATNMRGITQVSSYINGKCHTSVQNVSTMYQNLNFPQSSIQICVFSIKQLSIPHVPYVVYDRCDHWNTYATLDEPR